MHQSKRSTVTRRKFVKRIAAIVAAPVIIPASALGKDGRPAPSNRIVMGSIGVGRKGTSDMRTFLQQKDVQLVAVADVETRHRKRARKIIEDHYAGRSDSGTYEGCKDYNDLRDLIDRPDIDAVHIGTPDHWHALASIFSARAGKDIYCQKPLTANLAEGRILANTIDRYGTVFQTGSQLRSDWRARHICELVLNGRIGKLYRIETVLDNGIAMDGFDLAPLPEGLDYDLWLGPAPWAPYCKSRCHYNFRYQLDYSGGKLADWGAHFIDIGQLGMGAAETGPVEVEGEGEFPQRGLFTAPTEYRVTARYANGVEMIMRNKPIEDVEATTTGTTFFGSDGWVYVRYYAARASSPGLLKETIGADEIRLPVSNHHYRNFLDCVKTRQRPVAPVEHAHRTISVAHLGNIAMLLGRKVRWNPDTETCIDDATANRMLGRAMRSPWRL